MGVDGYLKVLRRWAGTILAAGLMAGIAALIVVSRVPPTFASDLKFLVGPISGTGDTVRAATAIANTYAQIATSTDVLEDAARRSSLNESPAELRERIQASSSEATRIVTIHAEAGEPGDAALLANNVAAALDALVGADAVGPEGQIRVVEAAVAMPDPVAPRPALTVGLAAAAGAVAAFVLLMLVGHLRDEITDPTEFSRRSGLAVLAKVAVPKGRPEADPPFVVATGSPWRIHSSYHLLAMRVAGSTSPFPPALLVTGLTGADPARQVGATLAATAAAYTRHVAWLDLSPSARVRAWLITQAGDGDGGVEATPLPLGKTSALALEDVQQMLEESAAQAGVVIVSGPPTEESPASLLWAGTCRLHVALTSLRDATSKRVSDEIDRLQSAGAQTIGAAISEPSPSVAFERNQPVARRGTLARLTRVRGTSAREP